MTTDPSSTCRRCSHDERTRGVLQLSALELYPPDHAPDCPAGLRDRIAALFRQPPGAERLGDATPGEIADAVLAELRGLTLRELELLHRPNTTPSRPDRPCPAREPLDGAPCSKQAGHEVHSDRPGRIWYPVVGEAELAAGRAAVLREAAEVAVREARGCGDSETGQYAASVAAGIGKVLRRMADEAQEAAEYSRALATPPSADAAAYMRERLADRMHDAPAASQPGKEA